MSNRWKCGGHRSRAAREVASAFTTIDVYRFLRGGEIAPGATRIGLKVNDVRASLPIVWEETHSIFAGIRPWFRCPTCSHRRRFLRVKDGRIGCVACLDLAYPSRVMRWKVARSLQRAARLRARIGAALQPFAPLPQAAPATRVYKIVQEIELCERLALSQGGSNDRQQHRRPGRHRQ